MVERKKFYKNIIHILIDVLRKGILLEEENMIMNEIDRRNSPVNDVIK